MKAKGHIWSIGFAALLVSSVSAAPAAAEPGPTAHSQTPTVREISQRLSDLEERYTVVDGAANAKAQWPLTISGSATAVIQGASTSRDATESNPVDASFSADIFIESPMGERGRAFVHLEGGSGGGIPEEIPSLTGLNADALGAGNTLQISEALYEHRYSDDFLVLTVGKLDATAYFDQNVFANNEAAQFISNSIVNSVAVPFPAYTAGVRAAVKIMDGFDIQAGYFDAGAEWEDFDDSSFAILELDLFGKALGGEGNLRAYYWTENLKRTAYTTGASREADGWGISADWDRHMKFLSNPEAHWGIFGRYSLRDGNINAWTFDKAWSVGMCLGGPTLSRANDMVGAAFSRADLSNEYLENAVAPADAPRFDREDLWEFYYRIAFTDRLGLTPHVQILNHRNGNSTNEKVTVFGARLEAAF